LEISPEDLPWKLPDFRPEPPEITPLLVGNRVWVPPLRRFPSLGSPLWITLSLSVSLWFSLSSSVWVRWIGREKEQIRRKERKEKKEQEGKRRKWEEREWFGLLVPFLFLPISRSLTLSLSLPVSLRKESKGRNGKEGERRRKKRRKEKQFSKWGAKFAWRRV